MARADAAAAEAALERNRATENAARAECDLAAAQLRVTALQKQEEGSDILQRRLIESEQRVRVRCFSCGMYKHDRLLCPASVLGCVVGFVPAKAQQTQITNGSGSKCSGSAWA